MKIARSSDTIIATYQITMSHITQYSTHSHMTQDIMYLSNYNESHHTIQHPPTNLHWVKNHRYTTHPYSRSRTSITQSLPRILCILNQKTPRIKFQFPATNDVKCRSCLEFAGTQKVSDKLFTWDITKISACITDTRINLGQRDAVLLSYGRQLKKANVRTHQKWLEGRTSRIVTLLPS